MLSEPLWEVLKETLKSEKKSGKRCLARAKPSAGQGHDRTPKAAQMNLSEGSVVARRPHPDASRRLDSVPVRVVGGVHHAYTTEDLGPVVAGSSQPSDLPQV